MPSDKDILQESKERYKVCSDGWDHIYKAALDDLRFVYDVDGGQWPDDIRKDREGRPMLTINKLLKFVRQLRGESRQNRPRIKVIPVDDKGDVQTAELYNGLIRQIEYLSSAEVAYDTAYMNAVSASVGYFRIITKYENEFSFTQDIGIRRIMNPFVVKYDPACKEFDLSDAEDCYIEEWLTKKEFERQYPGAATVDFDRQGEGQQHEGWFEKDKVRIAERFYKEYETIKIALVEIMAPEGLRITSTIKLNDESKAFIKKRKGKILQERETELTTVKWCKFTGSEVLEKNDWAGKYIPIIPVFGDEVIVNGKKHILSLIRGAKSPQQMYNYWSSAATEAVALVPKSPYIVYDKEVEGYENEWQEANRKNKMYMRVKRIPGSPKPTREPQAQIPTGIVAMMQNTSYEIEDQLGRYESSKGEQGNERSGKAILARVAQSDKGTFTFVDNLSRAIVYAGRQLIDLIPHIYDTERALQIQGEDGDQQTVTINQPTGRVRIDGKPEISNDLTVGKYDLIATVGASYSSRRQEMVDNLLQAMQYAPTIAPIIAPLIFQMSDWPGAQEVAKKLQTAIDNMPKEPATQGG